MHVRMNVYCIHIPPARTTALGMSFLPIRNTTRFCSTATVFAFELRYHILHIVIALLVNLVTSLREIEPKVFNPLLPLCLYLAYSLLTEGLKR